MSSISLQSVPVLNGMFRLQWEPAQECYVLLYPEGMVQLNGPAGEILSLVDGQQSVQHIIQTLQEKFPDTGELSDDVLEFLAEAESNNWLSASA